MKANFNFVNYFRRIAETLKDIAHNDTERRFYRMSSPKDLDEVMTNLSTATVPAIAVVDNFDGNYLTSSGNDGIKLLFTFIIFGRTIQDDHDHNQNQKELLRAIMQKIISLMKKHQRSDLEGITDHGLQRFNSAQVTFNTIGPLLDNLIGLSVTFNLDENNNIAYNPNDWTEEF